MKKILLLFVIFVSFFTFTSFAKAEGNINVQLPNVILKLNKQSTDTFFVMIKPVNESNPMPAVSEIALTGSGGGGFGTVSYENEGSYQYTVRQIKKDLTNINYDNTVYILTVKIYKDKSATIIKKTGSEKKEKELIFNNTYKDADPEIVIPPEKIKPKSKSNKKVSNPYTGDMITKYFITAIIAIGLILIIIIYIKNSRDDD